VRNLRSKVYRGELYWVDWSPGRGSEQTGRRPALVIQENPASSNPNYPLTIVLTLSTHGHNCPSHVAVLPTESNGLSVASYVKCEQVQTVSKERLGQRIGMLDQEVMARVNAALLRVLALPQS
jgi:mRNA interferase MazF